ncbi:hypothetical protein D3C81_2202910 [compost metagenome]
MRAPIRTEIIVPATKTFAGASGAQCLEFHEVWTEAAIGGDRTIGIGERSMVSLFLFLGLHGVNE